MKLQEAVLAFIASEKYEKMTRYDIINDFENKFSGFVDELKNNIEDAIKKGRYCTDIDCDKKYQGDCIRYLKSLGYYAVISSDDNVIYIDWSFR
jgi:hypothetical protein